MKQDSHPAAAVDEREALSALVDGELPVAQLAPLVRRWSTSADLREAWHCHQVIGDALRSEELAGRGGEARFLASLRERLAAEPVILAPTPTPTAQAEPMAVAPPIGPLTARRRRLVWAGGAAVAAGFAAVAAVLVSLQFPGGESTLAAATAPAPSVVSAVPVGTVPVGWVPPGSTPALQGRPPEPGAMIRNPRLDAYLDAHRQLGSGAWVAAPVVGRNLPQSAGASR